MASFRNRLGVSRSISWRSGRGKRDSSFLIANLIAKAKEERQRRELEQAQTLAVERARSSHHFSEGLLDTLTQVVQHAVNKARDQEKPSFWNSLDEMQGVAAGLIALQDHATPPDSEVAA
jgi:hypothetical protein